MMKTKKRFERGLATFLAVCLFMTSFQGVSWAETAEEDYGLEECLVDLDFDQLTDGIEKALQEKKSSDAWRAQFQSPDDSDMASIYQNLFDADSENPLYEVDYKFEEGALPKKAEVQIFVREKAADLYDIQNEGAEAETKAVEAPAAGGGQGTGTPETTVAPETDAPVEETATEAPTEETETTAAESETAEEVTTEAPTVQEPETEAPAEVETEADSQNEVEVQISENDVPVVEVALSDIMETVGEEETTAAAEEIESQKETTEAVEEGSEESSEETTEAVDETEESKSETDVEILAPTESETAETASASDAKVDATEAYVITGEEELVFLFKNKSDKDMMFQVRINGFVTEQAYVPSYSTMMDGYQVKGQAPAADPGAAGGAGGAAGTEETTTAPEEETTADVSAETDETTAAADETTAGNESETEETTVETEQPATEAPTETQAPATEPEQPATEAPVESGQEAPETEAEVQVINDEPVAEAPAPQEEAPAAAEPAPQENVPEEAAVAPENSELSASISRNDMPRLMASLDEDVIYEEEQAENGTVGVVLEPVVETTTKTRNVLLFSANSSDTAVTSAAVVPYSAVLLANSGDESPFTIKLYDYKVTTGDPFNRLNGYISQLSDVDNPNEKLFVGLQSLELNTYGKQNKYHSDSKYRNSVTQGIAENEYKDGELAFAYTTLPLFAAPASDSAYKDYLIAYENVEVDTSAKNGFFSWDNNGYFEFDSSKRYAQLNPTSESGRYSLNTRDYKKGEANQKGFWPFGKGENNWYFGMTLSFDFLMPRDGKVNGNDMEFEFSGDDDVWVYINTKDQQDGKLALDLGGIHGESGGSINFATGLITHNSVITYNENGHPTGSGPVYWYLYNDKKANGPITVGDKTISHVVGLDRTAWQEYRLDFYFMERGGTASNCKIRANMPTISKNNILIQKDIVGETTESTFYVDLYVEDSTAFTKKDTIVLSAENQYQATSKPLEEGTQFYLKEVDANGNEYSGASYTEWMIGGQVKNGTESAVGIVGTNNTAVCSNYYDFGPSINKKAIRDSQEADAYTVSLDVTGNQVTRTTESGNQTYYIKTADVVDELSSYVDFELDAAGLPQFTLGDRQLNAAKTATGYELMDGTTKVAEIVGKTINWAIVEDGKLGSTDIKTLSYKVRVTENAVYYGEADGDYTGKANTKIADNGTGTHAGTSGYYSNAEAKITYSTEIPGSTVNTKVFPHPVVRPKKPAGTLTITKNVDVTGLETTDEETFAKGETFDFTLRIENISVPEIKVEGETVSIANRTYERTADNPIQLKDSDSFAITGLNKGARYTITEKAYSNSRYSSELDNIEVKENGAVDPDVDYSGNTISGTIRAITSTETVEQRGYQTSVGVDADDTIQYGSWTKDEDTNHVDGWYDGNERIPEGDPRLQVTVPGEDGEQKTIVAETETRVTGYKWVYNKAEYIAGLDPEVIQEMQDDIEADMRNDGYNNIQKENTFPYAVTGSIKKTIERKEEGPNWWKTYSWLFNGKTYKANIFWDAYAAVVTAIEEAGYIVEKGEVWDKTITYTETITCSAEETEKETKVWTYKGQRYTYADDLIAVLQNEGYHASHDESTGTITYSTPGTSDTTRPATNAELFDKGYIHRKYSVETNTSTGTNRDANVVVTFTNKFEKKGTITVQKVITGNPERVEDYKFSLVDANGNKISGYSYSYIVTAEDGTETVINVDNTDGNFEIKGAGTVELILDGALQDMAETSGVYIKEEHSDADRINWNREDQAYGDTSDVVKIGGTVVCENIYFNQTLEIAKNLSEDSYSQIPDAYEVFEFEVELPDTLAMITYDVSKSEGVTFAKGVVSEEKPGIISLTNGKFTCYIPAGKTLVLTKIPDGASYTVAEKNFKETGTYYDMELVRTEHKTVGDNPAVVEPGTGTAVSKEISGEFNAAVNSSEENHSIAYTNKVTPRYVDIVIEKTLVDSESFKVANEKEDVTINFEITNEDTNSLGNGNKFYASITIPGNASEKSESVTIANLPVGKYKVTELPHMRYRLASDSENDQVIDTTATLAAGDAYKAEFRNYKTSNNYFTDTDVIVNGLNGSENGWTFVKKTVSTAIFNFTTNANSETSPFGTAEQPVRALVPIERPKFGEGTYDNGEIPLV